MSDIMRYIEYDYADKLLNRSKYYIKDAKSNIRKWNDVFKNNNPIDVEIGPGRGAFIIEMAKENPDRNFIGIELYPSQLVPCVNELNSLDLPNLRLIVGDAIDIDDYFFKEIDTIYINFPDPWPNKTNTNRRLTHERFLQKYDKIYKKNKHLILKTDNKIFFAFSLESLSEYWYSFKRVSLDLHNDERNIKSVMTNYEIEYSKTDNRPIYYLEAEYK